MKADQVYVDPSALTRLYIHQAGSREMSAWRVRTKEGRTRTRLQQWLHRSIESLQGRILSFNVATAHVWADQKFLVERAGHRMPVQDSYIAATARRHDLTIVTGNDKDFRRSGLKVFNPFTELTIPGN